MYINFILNQLKVLGMVIIGFFIFPFILYPKRRKIWKMNADPSKKWFWFYADTSETGFDTEENNYLNSVYGIYELVKKKDSAGNWVPDYEKFNSFSKLRKFFLSYHWQVFRNGVWNYIRINIPIQGEWINFKELKFEGDKTSKHWRNKSNLGIASITWQIKDDPKEETFFRYSFSRRAKWWNIQRILTFLFRLIFTFKIVWHKDYNFMMGSDDRELIKSRTFNRDEV